MKKIVKICLISFALVLVFGVSFSAIYLATSYAKYQKIPLNTQALTSPSLSIEIFDSENKPIKDENQFNGDFCKIEDLNNYTIEAFVSIEDKDFFKHNGINKKRIAKAMLNNLKSGKLKEGASTISQQLIKNTHLSNEKTFERKLKEVALTKKLEKKFDKKQILESYLNIIYFGNNCYGIENASNYYFNKSAKDLTLSESCTLAGIIKSPTKYSPISNYKNALNRRNLVLNEMEKDKKITPEQKIEAQKQEIVLNITPKSQNKLNSYSQASLDEACKILNLSAKNLAIGGYKIHTYLDENKQQTLKNALIENSLDEVDYAGIVIDADACAVRAYYGDSDYKILDIKRQPASCIKPLLVYTPAFNEGILSPETQILDEKITIGSYTPQNVNKKFAGHVSVTDAVKNSINIPAIKALSYVGIDTGKQYAEKLGIKFDEKDDSYALALGGMTYGTNLKDLASAYTVFVNKGEFDKPNFVQYITDKNDQLVYVHKPNKKMVFREDSAYLMTTVLQETAKSGTARKLSDIKHVEVASKTGTSGKKAGNTDAYNITYTPSEVVGVWFGSLDNTPASIAGGNQPTQAVKSYLNSQNYQKTEFDIPSSVTDAKIDTLELEENHRLVLASPYAPERYTKTALFSRFNMPTEVSTNFLDKPKIDANCKVENNQILLTLNTQKHLTYKIFKNDIPFQTITDKNEPLTLRINFVENEATLKISASYNDSEEIESEKVFNLTQTKTHQQPKSKWYI